LKHNIKKIDIQQSCISIPISVMNSSVKAKTNAKIESKEKQEQVVERMEGGILVRRYKGKKVDVET